VEAFKKKYFQKLKYKSKYINLEYEESVEIYNQAKFEFLKSVSEYANKSEKENPFLNNIQKEETKKDKINGDGKKIYREIVNKTHPDKLININEDKKEELQSLYNEASQAKNKNDLDSLFRIASRLNIENEDITIDSINRIEQQIKEKEDYIEKIHKDVAWIWYYANKKERDIILKNIFSKMCN